jgi:ankyrin repeat protein
MQLLTLLLMFTSQFASISVAAQQRESQLNADEQTFQELVGARRSPLPILQEETSDLGRIEALLSKNISAEIKGDALARAASSGDVELLQLLIHKGANVNYAGEQGQTVLMLAAAGGFSVQCGNDPVVTSYRGNVEAVKSLLDAGAGVNNEDRDGNTALMLAAQHARSDSVKLLLDAGANVHVKNKYGWTALIHVANSSGYYDPANVKEIVEAFIAGGADVNARDREGKTALTYAVPSAAITSMLLSVGAIE